MINEPKTFLWSRHNETMEHRLTLTGLKSPHGPDEDKSGTCQRFIRLVQFCDSLITKMKLE